MNEQDINKLAETRITRIKALKKYMDAVSCEREGFPDQAMDIYKDAFASYNLACEANGLTADDFDIVLEITQKLQMGPEVEMKFRLKKKEALEKAEWERSQYLKKRYINH